MSPCRPGFAVMAMRWQWRRLAVAVMAMAMTMAVRVAVELAVAVPVTMTVVVKYLRHFCHRINACRFRHVRQRVVIGDDGTCHGVRPGGSIRGEVSSGVATPGACTRTPLPSPPGVMPHVLPSPLIRIRAGLPAGHGKQEWSY